MPKTKRNARSKRSTRARSNGRSTSPRQQDAIALLKADHRQVETWFDQFESTRSDARKKDLATRICAALRAHTTIEEEIFYPAFLEATGETDVHHEAEVEHDGAKKLMDQIEASGPDDEYFDARVTVLSEMIKHHVREEEKRDGMFAKARSSDMDLAALGQQLAERKAQVMGGMRSGMRSEESGDRMPRRRGSMSANTGMHAAPRQSRNL